MADELLEESVEELFEDAPCGYLTTSLDGTILKVNRTFEAWSGLARQDLVERRRFQELLSAGGRIYYETHYAPLLHLQGFVREVAVDFVSADGTALPALINSSVGRDATGRPRSIRTAVFEARDRRRYEQELLEARRRERAIAEELQRSLLSGALPEGAGLELAVGYRPGVAGLDVGGDWYDAFWLEQGEMVGLVVGDVVGRGIGAAATMGQLRSAVRALASTTLAPGRLLEALDAYARRHGVGGMATVVYADLHLGSRRLRFSCAGHPPPLIVPADGEAYFAWQGRSTPLDVFDGGPRDEGAAQLAPEDLIVLYTDGLVEDPSRTLDEGLERLRAELETSRGQPVAEIPSAVIRTLAGERGGDDACLVAARLSEPA